MCWNRTEERTIPAFCSTLAAIEERQVTIVSKPDCRSGGCDAIIDRAGVRVALEHTTVDTFAEQRHWEKACGPVLQTLEERIRRAHPGAALGALGVSAGQSVGITVLIFTNTYVSLARRCRP